MTLAEQELLDSSSNIRDSVNEANEKTDYFPCRHKLADDEIRTVEEILQVIK